MYMAVLMQHDNEKLIKTRELYLLIRLRKQQFLNPADLLCVVGVRKWPLDKSVHLYIYIICRWYIFNN